MQLTYLHIHNFKSIRDMEIRDIDRALILGRALLYLPYHCRPGLKAASERPSHVPGRPAA